MPRKTLKKELKKVRKDIRRVLNYYCPHRTSGEPIEEEYLLIPLENAESRLTGIIDMIKASELIKQIAKDESDE